MAETRVCKTHIKLKNQILLHYFCDVVGISMNGTAIYSLVEPRINDSSKWRRILDEGRAVTPDSFEKLNNALLSPRVDLSKRQRYVADKEMAELQHNLLWKSLQNSLDTKRIIELTEALPYQIKRTIMKPSEYLNHFSRLDHCPGSVKINIVEKIGSYNALAALFLLLRDERYRIEKSADEHIHRAAFRLLLSFFQHPSFFRFRHEIWQLVLRNIIRLDLGIMEKMGLGFWSLPMVEIEKMIAEESRLLRMAINANIVEDFKDAPLFFTMLYRNADCTEIIEGLASIAAGKPTSMGPIDMFFIRFTNNRRRGPSTLQAPSISFESLAIN